MSALPQPERELDTAAFRWQWAFDAEDRALKAAEPLLRPAKLLEERHALAQERQEVASQLSALAFELGIEPPPWFPHTQISLHTLGLPAETQACVFDLDGVLTDSGALHASAWAQTLESLLLDIAHSGRAFVPFDPGSDYLNYFDGRSRIEGIHLFLASRGVRLPEGDTADTAAVPTVLGLARRKAEILERVLRQRGIGALAGARRYLRALGYARIPCAVVSASAATLPILRIAALQHLIEVRVDAERMQAEGLKPRPSPDLLLAACRSLDVEPAHAVSFTHSGAGVVAAARLGMHVIAVAAEPLATELCAFGAPVAVPALSSLLEPPLGVPEPRRERPRTWS